MLPPRCQRCACESALPGYAAEAQESTAGAPVLPHEVAPWRPQLLAAGARFLGPIGPRPSPWTILAAIGLPGFGSPPALPIR